VQAFLQVCEQERGAIAVHCKAGLGRTGTNIAAYMMKHYGYTAKEATAWCRICRPGSVVGPQQQYLVSIEDKMFQEGNLYRERNRVHLPSSPSPITAQSQLSASTPQRHDSTGNGQGALLTTSSLFKRSDSGKSASIAFNNPDISGSAAQLRPNTSGGLLRKLLRSSCIYCIYTLVAHPISTVFVDFVVFLIYSFRKSFVVENTCK
jgi:hypothetical protein